jgi:multidrug efflux system membrane fusion protein
MRLFSILTAIIAALAVYAFVFERTWLTVTLAPAAAPDTDAPAPVVATDTAPTAVRVVAVHSRAQDIGNAVVIRGQTQAQRQVDVRAETSGRIVSEPLRKGAFVEAGQLLCQLDSGTRQAALAEARARSAEAETRIPEGKARLAEAEAQLAEAQINNTAASKLSESGFASDTRVASTRAALSAGRAAVQAAKSGLDAARTGIEAAEASAAGAREELTRLEIAAPFAGLLESDTAELGSLMQPGSLCATIIQLDPIKLIGFVPETEINRIDMGAQARATLVSGTKVSGMVTFLSRSADPETRTFRVEMSVPNPDLAIRDGQTAEIMIASDGMLAHLLPQSALTLDDGGLLGVRVVKNETADFFPVTLVRDTLDGIWVSGLPDAVDVIVIGQEYIITGVPVLATYRSETGANSKTEGEAGEAQSDAVVIQ